MAKYNEILAGRYNRFIQKLFSMKGPAPAPQLSSDIAMQMSFFNGVENRYLESWNRWGVGLLLPALAAVIGNIRIRNPINSNALVVLEKILIGNVGAAQEIDVAHQASVADLNLFGTFSLDGRQGPTGASASTCVVSQVQSNVNAFTNIIARPLLGAAGNFDLILFEDQEIALLPGFALQIQSTVANQAITGTFAWRERFLEDSERT